MSSAIQPAAAPHWAQRPSYKWSVVGMLWCISLFNYADRQAIFSVFPLLEKEMNLDSVQLGLLGSAFAWVYGAFAPFAGLIVDRVKRTKAILFGLHAWSIICMATGFSKTFNHLFFFRAAEGLGETFYYPASMSLLSDYHGKRTRSRAMGVHQTSVYIGTVAGGFFAGLIGQHYGWRWSFYVFGGLGILLGFVLHKFLIEPRRGASDEPGDNPHEMVAGRRVPLAQFVRELGRNPTAILLLAAFVCMNFVAVVLLSWMPKYLYDAFKLDLAAAGLMATIFAQAASAAGAPLGGWLADVMRAKTRAGRILVQASAAVLAAPFVLLCGNSQTLMLAVVSLGFWGLFKGFYDANIWASLLDVIRPEARGTAVGFGNLVGWLGGGTAPLIVGWMAKSMGLGAAIGWASAVYALGALLLFTASRTMLRHNS